MNTKKLQNELNKCLTIEQLSELDGFPSFRHIWDWTKNKGLKVKQGSKWIRYQLPTIQSESKIMINPDDLVKFLKETKREELIKELPSYLRK